MRHPAWLQTSSINFTVGANGSAIALWSIFVDARLKALDRHGGAKFAVVALRNRVVLVPGDLHPSAASTIRALVALLSGRDLPPRRRRRHPNRRPTRRNSSWLQVKASPPVPALRLVVVTNLIAEATLLAFHVTPLLVLKHVRRWRQWRQPQAALPSLHKQQETALCAASGGPADGCSCSGSEQGSAEASPKAGQTASTDVAACCHSVVRMAEEKGGEKGQPASPQRHPQPQPASSSVRPPLPLLRGLSRRVDDWQRERPRLHRRLALAAITLSFMGCCSLQILAPGFVDVSIGGASVWLPLALFRLRCFARSFADRVRRQGGSRKLGLALPDTCFCAFFPSCLALPVPLISAALSAFFCCAHEQPPTTRPIPQSC